MIANSFKYYRLHQLNLNFKNNTLSYLNNRFLFHINIQRKNNFSNQNQSYKQIKYLYSTISSKKYLPLRPLTQNLTTLFITKDFNNAILPSSKMDFLFLLPSFAVIANNYITAWTYLSSSLFAFTCIASFFLRQAYQFAQTAKVLAWEIQLSPSGKLLRYYVTVKNTTITQSIAQLQGGSSADVRNQFEWFQDFPQDYEQKKQKYTNNEKLINPLTGKKAYPHPKQQASLFTQTALINLIFAQKLRRKTVRFKIQPSEIIKYTFKSQKMNQISKPTNEQNIKSFMKSVQNELLQIQTTCRPTTQKKGNKKFIIPLNQAADSKYKQIIIALGLQLDVNFK